MKALALVFICYAILSAGITSHAERKMAEARIICTKYAVADKACEDRDHWCVLGCKSAACTTRCWNLRGSIGASL